MTRAEKLAERYHAAQSGRRDTAAKRLLRGTKIGIPCSCGKVHEADPPMPAPACGHETVRYRCPDCYVDQAERGREDVLGRRLRDKLEKDHSFGRHRRYQSPGRVAVEGCQLCWQLARSDASMAAGALADIFNPLPMDYVPKGFRR